MNRGPTTMLSLTWLTAALLWPTATAAQHPGVPSVDALWIAESEGLLEIVTDDGNHPTSALVGTVLDSSHSPLVMAIKNGLTANETASELETMEPYLSNRSPLEDLAVDDNTGDTRAAFKAELCRFDLNSSLGS